MYSEKVSLDKFYTKPNVVLKCIEHIDFSIYDFVIEPSAGSGAFFHQIPHKNKIGLDLEPEADGIVYGDWFNYKIDNQYQKVLVIGNPPFGKRNHLSKKFIQHTCSFDSVYTIAFILPDVYNKHTLQKSVSPSFRLKEIIKLEDDAFLVDGNSYHVPCSFFIFEKSTGPCLRFNHELYKETQHWRYGDKNNYDFFVLGAAINSIKDVPTDTNRGYYIKVKRGIKVDSVKQNFKNLKPITFSSVSGGVAWITKPELVKIYKENITHENSSPNISKSQLKAGEFFEF